MRAEDFSTCGSCNVTFEVAPGRRSVIRSGGPHYLLAAFREGIRYGLADQLIGLGNPIQRGLHTIL